MHCFCNSELNLVITQGTSLDKVFQWASLPINYRAITALSTNPPATLTVTDHGMPDGWPAAVVSAKWANGLNANGDDAKPEEYRQARVKDENTVVFDGVNSSGWKYKPGGYLCYYEPVSLNGCSAVLTVKDKHGQELMILSSATGGITLDDAAKKITVHFLPTLNLMRGDYELIVTNAAGYVSKISCGAFEVTNCPCKCDDGDKTLVVFNSLAGPVGPATRNRTVFLKTSQSWTVPEGVECVYVMLQGGGAGGGSGWEDGGGFIGGDSFIILPWHVTLGWEPTIYAEPGQGWRGGGRGAVAGTITDGVLRLNRNPTIGATLLGPAFGTFGLSRTPGSDGTKNNSLGTAGFTMAMGSTNSNTGSGGTAKGSGADDYAGGAGELVQGYLHVTPGSVLEITIGAGGDGLGGGGNGDSGFCILIYTETV